MGYDIGITGNYRRFQEQKLLEDYLKAVPSLTINNQKTTQLQQQVAPLTVRSEEQKLVTERKLAEKEKEIQAVVREAEERAREMQKKQDDLKVMQEELLAIYKGVLSYFELNEPKIWKNTVLKSNPRSQRWSLYIRYSSIAMTMISALMLTITQTG